MKPWLIAMTCQATFAIEIDMTFPATLVSRFTTQAQAVEASAAQTVAKPSKPQRLNMVHYPKLSGSPNPILLVSRERLSLDRQCTCI